MARTSWEPFEVGFGREAAMRRNTTAKSHWPVAHDGSFADVVVECRTNESVSSDWWKSRSTECFTWSDCEPGTSKPPWDSRSDSFCRNGIAATRRTTHTAMMGHRRRWAKAPIR